MKANPYKTILIIVTGFIFLSYLFPSLGKYLYPISLAIGMLSIASNKARDWVVWSWGKFSETLGWINAKIILSIVFIFFLTPIALLYRLIKGDTLMKKRPQGNSIFVNRNRQFTAGDLENPW